MTSTSATKKFRIVFDVICILVAVVLIAFGTYVLCSYQTNEAGSLAMYGYIGIGAAALVIILFGLLGALRENVCCTVTFIVLMYIVIIAQAAVVFFMTKNSDSLASNMANALDLTWEEEVKNPGAMSLYENWFNCCGRGSPQDYIVHDRLPPASCFVGGDNTQSEKLIGRGCRVEFEDYWIYLFNIFNILAWVLVALELLGTVVSCCLCNSIRNDHRRSYF